MSNGIKGGGAGDSNKFRAVLFDMGGVIVRYKSPEILQNLMKSGNLYSSKISLSIFTLKNH